MYFAIKRILFAGLIDRIKRDIAEPQTTRIIRTLSPSQLVTHLMLQRLIFGQIVLSADKRLSLHGSRTSHLITSALHSSIVTVLLHVALTLLFGNKITYLSL